MTGPSIQVSLSLIGVTQKSHSEAEHDFLLFPPDDLTSVESSLMCTAGKALEPRVLGTCELVALLPANVPRLIPSKYHGATSPSSCQTCTV